MFTSVKATMQEKSCVQISQVKILNGTSTDVTHMFFKTFQNCSKIVFIDYHGNVHLNQISRRVPTFAIDPNWDKGSYSLILVFGPSGRINRIGNSRSSIIIE